MNDYLFNPYEVLLHKRTRHSNMYVPYCRYISGNTFPDQYAELINTVITLKYRDYNRIDNEVNTSIPLGRPSDDDVDFYDRSIGPEDYDEHRVYTGRFRVVRADSSEPFVLIGLSEDYSKVIINSTRKNDTGEFEFKSKISTWAIQDNNFFGLDIKDKHTGEVDELNAVSIQVDDGEPCHSIMVEFLGSTGMIRLVLGDECLSRIQDYYNEDFHFDGRDAVEYENPVDIDGYYASHRGIITKDIDGGHAGNLERLLYNRYAGEHPDEYEPMPYDEEIKYEFGDLDDPEKPTIQQSFDFGDEDIEPVPDEPDDGEFNFGDYEPEDTDYDFGDLETDAPIPFDTIIKFEYGDLEDPNKPVVQDAYVDFGDEDENPPSGEDDEAYNFDNYEPEPPVIEDPPYNFGDQDSGPIPEGEDDGEFLGDEEDVKYLDDGYLYEFGEAGIEFTNPTDGDFNFSDADEDPVSGDDDLIFNFEDEDIEVAKLEDPYEFGDITVDYVDADGEFDFGDIDEIGVIDDDDDGKYNFGDLDWIDPVPEPEPEPEPPIVRIYTPIPELKLEDIINFRRMIFERKTIYGSL